ncbi:MAG: hypothetical protein M3N25_04225 [Actinomycetota bacterium]|nr:hypothetical protein [Actinomycetota bacterium]
MGAQRTSFAKLQRDRAKKANAAAKRERRQAKQEPTEEEAGLAVTTPAEPGGELSASELLEQIEQVHRQFQAKQIDQDQYDEKKAELLARLPID